MHLRSVTPKVVRLEDYRKRATRALPLFDAPPVPAFGKLTPFRSLTDREVRHRERMMRHLLSNL
jgi:hypothetical protein